MNKTYKKNVLRARPRLLYAGVHGGTGWCTQAQAAENVEIVFVGKGSGKTETGEDTYPFTTGDLILFNTGRTHREWLDDGKNNELFFFGVGNLHLYGQAPGTLLPDRDFCLVHAAQFSSALHAYARELVTESEANQPLGEAVAEHLLKIMLLLCVRLAVYDGERTFGENVNYIEAKKYFDEHFLEIETIDAVCKSLYVNKYYLSHLFSQNMGIPPVRYLINKRIDLACRYLETTDDNVADIGKACGYADPCYFSRMFKKVKHVTPLRYRYLFKLNKK